MSKSYKMNLKDVKWNEMNEQNKCIYATTKSFAEIDIMELAKHHTRIERDSERGRALARECDGIAISFYFALLLSALFVLSTFGCRDLDAIEIETMLFGV